MCYVCESTNDSDRQHANVSGPRLGFVECEWLISRQVRMANKMRAHRVSWLLRYCKGSRARASQAGVRSRASVRTSNRVAHTRLRLTHSSIRHAYHSGAGCCAQRIQTSGEYSVSSGSTGEPLCRAEKNNALTRSFQFAG